jgi:hypothetical protein
MYSVHYRSHVDPSGFCNNVVWVLVDLNTSLHATPSNPDDESTTFPRTLVSTYKPTPCQNPWDNDLKNIYRNLRWNLCHLMEFPSDSTKTSRDNRKLSRCSKTFKIGNKFKLWWSRTDPRQVNSAHTWTLDLVYRQYTILQKKKGAPGER